MTSGIMQETFLPTTIGTEALLFVQNGFIIFWNQRYSKRITLAAVYGATEVFMLQDRCFQIGFFNKILAVFLTNCFSSRSPNFEETWAFLDRRLGDLQAAPSLAQVSNHSPFCMCWFC